ncbi:MAG TPA: twin transmembrane helix small protein [Herbaspirillum sp.]|nr:twin transmembrane helix small protein [Herbaspirillum sp.]
MKVIIAISFLLILGSLAGALLFLMRDKGKSQRMVHALTLRIVFSVLLFILLLAAHQFGLIQPSGIR